MTKYVLLMTCLSTMAMAEGEEAPVRVTFTVQGGTSSPLLSGDAAVQPNRTVAMERRAAKGPERQSLLLDLRPLDDASFLVRATWNDVTADGASVKWEPSFVVRRGADAKVRLDYPGGARTLHLTAN